MNEFSEQLKSADGQQWLALQYVLNELSEEQRGAFEDAMANDAGLCEDVVEACRLSAGVVLACESDRAFVCPAVVCPVMVRSRQSMSTKFGVFAACAALVALLLVVSLSVRNDVSGNMVAADEAAAADALVELLQEQLLSSADPEADAEATVEDSLADLVAPEWLLTAVDLDELAVPGDDESGLDDSNLF